MDQFHKALMELNMDSPEELQSYIQKLTLAVEQAKQKILQAEANLEVDVVDSKPEVTGAWRGKPLGPLGLVPSAFTHQAICSAFSFFFVRWGFIQGLRWP